MIVAGAVARGQSPRAAVCPALIRVAGRGARAEGLFRKRVPRRSRTVWGAPGRRVHRLVLDHSRLQHAICDALKGYT